MTDFTLDTVSPPVVTTIPGGTMVWDKRNYTVQSNPGNPNGTFVLIQQLGYLGPNGIFVPRKTELQLVLCTSAYALIDQSALAAAATNTERVIIIQAALTTDQANKKAALPPSALAYTSPIVLTENIAMTPAAPNVKGTVTGYSISPALPAGIEIDPTTGIISGTPTVTAVAASYTVTATNSNSSTSTTAVVSITVNAAA